MADETQGATTPDPETTDKVLSQLHSHNEELSSKLVKAEQVIKDQIAARKKAETALKSKQTDEEQQASELAQRLEAAEQDRQQMKEKLTALERDQTRSAVVSAISAVASKLVPGADKTLTKLLNIDVTVDEHGQTIVLNDEGKRRINAKTGRAMTIEELRDEYLTNNDFLLAATMKGGQGARGNAGASDPEIDLIKLEAMGTKERADYIAKLSKEQRDALYSRAGLLTK